MWCHRLISTSSKWSYASQNQSANQTVPSSCVAGGSLSILNSSLVSSSEPSFPAHTTRVSRHFQQLPASGGQSEVAAERRGHISSPSLTSWMMSTGREKLFSVLGNGRISDSCCVSHKQLRHTPTASEATQTCTVCACPHQGLHVIHGSQVVPDNGGRHLPADVLAELISDADHVEVSVDSCRQRCAHVTCNSRTDRVKVLLRPPGGLGAELQLDVNETWQNNNVTWIKSAWTTFNRFDQSWRRGCRQVEQHGWCLVAVWLFFQTLNTSQ